MTLGVLTAITMNVRTSLLFFFALMTSLLANSNPKMIEATENFLSMYDNALGYLKNRPEQFKKFMFLCSTAGMDSLLDETRAIYSVLVRADQPDGASLRSIFLKNSYKTAYSGLSLEFASSIIELATMQRHGVKLDDYLLPYSRTEPGELRERLTAHLDRLKSSFFSSEQIRDFFAEIEMESAYQQASEQIGDALLPFNTLPK